VPGGYVVAPYVHAAWVPGAWVRHRPGWVWIAGHWRLDEPRLGRR
jgi:hypothetical protein